MATATKPSKKRKKKKSVASNRLKKDTLRGALNQQDIDPEAFEAFGHYLKKREKPVSVDSLLRHDLPTTSTALLWGISESLVSRLRGSISFGGLLKAAKSTKRGGKAKSKSAGPTKSIKRWLRQSRLGQWSLVECFETISVCYQMPLIAPDLDAEEWNETLRRLVEITSLGNGNAGPLVKQLLHVELPLTLAYLFPEIDFCWQLVRPAIQRMADCVQSVLDSEGMIHAGHLSSALPLLASWTRCRTMIKSVKTEKLPRDARATYSDLVRHLLRIVNVDGSVPFAEKDDIYDRGLLRSLFKACSVFLDDDRDNRLIQHVMEKKVVSDEKLPLNPGYHSEWAQLAFLQPDWTPTSPRLALDFSRFQVRFEIRSAGLRLFSGSWAPEFRINGTEFFAEEKPWEVVCWYNDFDVDYLELCWKLDPNWMVFRQFLMARQDLFLYMADNLVGKDSADIDYQHRLVLADELVSTQAKETREIAIKARKRYLANVFPLALQEWQSDPRGGSFSTNGSALELRQWGIGSSMCVPLFVDLHKNRLKKPLTWRNLTVAENLNILERDDAVAYRVQAGPEQWLFYRAMATEGNRTVLGQNTTSEFLCGRFLEDGDVESIVEVE